MSIIQKVKEEPQKFTRIFLPLFFVLTLTGFCYFAGYSLIIPLLLLFLGLHISFLGKGNTKIFLQLGLLLTIILFTTHIIVTYTHIPPYYIPVAGIAMLTMLLFNDLQYAAIMSFSASAIVTLVVGGNLEMMVIYFIGSLTGAYSVRDARTRGPLINAGIFISAISILAIFLLNPDMQLIMQQSFAVDYLYPLLANGVISAFLVVAGLKVFESLFGVLTNFSLMELADRNQPLLKRMAFEAAGTWQHSLVVSQLAETAAEEIGANALLTRVGAYYHDIGKMTKAEYFTENQLMMGNKHDEIEPSMSRLVILNHVKEGIELAKKSKLNQQIVDFIPQHHGTSLMYFFYQRAIEEKDENTVINENDYRYPGPKPQTRETAITLLADSVEGAVRSLDDPNPNRIEETVLKVINNKFIDGQLDECNLTLREINTIAKTFTRLLSAMYHGRVKYPEKKNGQSAKSPNKNTPPPEET